MFDIFQLVLGFVAEEFGWLTVLILIVAGARFWWLYQHDLSPPPDRLAKREAHTNDYQKFRRHVMKRDPFMLRYKRILRRTLGRIDRFYGDVNEVGDADRKTVRGYLSGASFDRSLWLALIYPMATLLGVWVVSGEVGPVERALGLNQDIVLGLRALTAAFGLLVLLITVQKPIITNFQGFEFRLILIIIIILFSLFITSDDSVVLWVFLSIAASFLGKYKTINIIFIVSLTFSLLFIIFNFTNYFIAILSCSILFFILIKSLGFYELATRKVPGINLILILCIGVTLIVSGYFGFADISIIEYLPQQIIFRDELISIFNFIEDYDPDRVDQRILLVALVMLPTVNGVLDWLSLAVTRGLLRKGLKRGGIYPALLGLLDVAFALAALFALTGLSVAFIALFNGLSGDIVFNTGALINQIYSNPHHPALWWVYVTLATTLLPSVLNLGLGLIALLGAARPPTMWPSIAGLPATPDALTDAQRMRVAGALTVRTVLVPLALLLVAALSIDLILAFAEAIGWALVDFTLWVQGVVAGIF